MSDQAGELINGRYRLVEVIGQGAMGTVWRGHDEALDREVSIKKILLASDLDEEERVELREPAIWEARATARLAHPGIIEHDDAPVIVMELIRGRSLAEILKEEVRLPWRRVAEIGATMVDALREAHAAGIVHRDLKPANVLITDRRTVITDVAQRSGERTAADPGEMTGTPAFIPPEQAENAPASPAADLWSLGATLFNAVEGRPPFEGPDYATVRLTLLTQDPPEPRRGGPLTPVITALLARDPARRPDLDRLADMLEAALDDYGGPPAVVAASPPAPPANGPAPAAVSVSEDNDLAFTSDGKNLAVAAEDWNPRTRRETAAPAVGKAESLAFGDDGGLLAVSGADGTVRRWDLKARRQLADWSVG